MITRISYIGNDINSSRVCIDDYQEGVIIGRIYHTLHQEPIRFRGCITMLKEMEALMNTYDFPQADVRLRTFQSNQTLNRTLHNWRLKEEYQVKNWIRGSRATFGIRILYRHNATWQGTIRWIEGAKDEHFRSVLEMIFLIESCFTKEKEKENTSTTITKESVI